MQHRTWVPLGLPRRGHWTSGTPPLVLGALELAVREIRGGGPNAKISSSNIRKNINVYPNICLIIAFKTESFLKLILSGEC